MLFRCWTFVEYAAFFINPFIRFIDHYVGRAVVSFSPPMKNQTPPTSRFAPPPQQKQELSQVH